MFAVGDLFTAMSTVESTDLWTTFHRAALFLWMRLRRSVRTSDPSRYPWYVVVSALFDAVGELGHLVEELAVLAHLRVNLLH